MKRYLTRRIIPIILVVAGLCAGGLWAWNRGVFSQSSAQTTADSSYTQVYTVQRGDLQATLSVVGELDAVRQADLAFEHASGSTALLELNVHAGSQVKAGDILAGIDPEPYQQAVDEAQSALQAAEETLAELETPPTQEDIAQADLAIAKAQYQLEKAGADLDDLLSPDIDALQTKVAEARNDLAQSQASLLGVEGGEDSYQEQLSRLQDKEAEAWENYSRLASESYTDEYHQDRLQLALNAFLDAKDARLTAEIQRQMELLQAKMQVSQAEQALKEAEEALAEAQAGGDSLAVANAKLAVQEAELALLQAQEARTDLDQGADEVELAQARADLQAKRLALQQAEEALAGATLTAPFDGTILAVYAQAGDRISATTAILTIADLSQLQVVATVDETLIRQVAQGQPATITFDALPGQTFAGQVQEVPLQGELQGGVMVYEVPISLEDIGDAPLLVGMTADVEIATGTAQDALLVPAMALQRSGGVYQVLVQAGDGSTTAVPVEVGVSDGVYTQIVRGLNEGDKVVFQVEDSSSNSNFRGMGGLMGGSVPRNLTR